MKTIKSLLSLCCCLLALISFIACSGDTNEPTTHVVSFDVSGGSEVASRTVTDGETLASLPETSREGYTFVGWYLDGEEFSVTTAITADITLTAYWTKDIIIVTYTVTFLGDDGTVLKTENVEEGGSATAPDLPIVQGKLFVKWDTSFTNVHSDLTVKAVYFSKIWTVSFYDEEGEELIAEVEVGDGGSAKCPVAPEKTGYKFTGWDGFYTNVHRNETCYATYEKIRPTVTFYDINGEILSYSTTSYGKSVVPPIPPAIQGKVFSHWEGTYQNVTADSNVYAIYVAATYDVTFYDLEGNEIAVVKVEYGESANAPIAPNVAGYKFSGWSADFTNVTSNIKVKALYEVATFKVTFYGIDEVVLDTQIVDYGYDALAPKAPVVSGKTFKKWSTDFTSVTKDLDVYAIYEVSKSVAVVFDAAGGNVQGKATLAVTLQTGSKITYVPKYAGYDFVGWFYGDELVETITAAGTYKAKWSVNTSASDMQAVKAALAPFSALKRTLRENLTLPTYDSDHGVSLSWESNASMYLKADGTIKRTLTESHDVMLTVTGRKGNYTESLSLSFTVARGVKELPKQGICASYVYSGVGRLTSEVLNGLDIIYMAFDSVDASGNVALVKSDVLAARGIKRAHAAGTRVVMSLQNKSAFATIAASATLTTTFVNNVINVLKKYDLDGVDIDWEFPSSSQSTTYTSFMKALYTTLKAKNSEWLITSAIGAGPWQYNYFDLSHSAKYHDYINMMSYDMQSGGRGSFQNALYYYSANGNYYLTNECTIQATVNFYKNRSVAASQIIVGIAFYGRIFSGCSGMGKSASSVSSVTYSSIKRNYLANLGANIAYTYDTSACAPYIVDYATNEVITYDDETSIAAKAAYCASQGLAGLMAWQFGQDSDNLDLLNAMKENLTRTYE